MREKMLWDLQEPRQTPAARIDDPLTSHLAEQQITQSGDRSAACALALSLVRKTPGLTANEYEKSIGVQDGRIRKRLNDLLKDGKVKKGPPRVSAVTGKLNQTWLPA